jgi:cyclopropane-fatty-acyl-phospholipid synthase
MNRLLRNFLTRAIRTGSMAVVDPAGTVHRFGDGSPPTVTVRFASPAVERAVILNPQMKLGEAFMDGGFVVEQGSIYDFLALVLSNDQDPRPSPLADLIARFRRATRHVHALNSRTRARDNAVHHYDLDRRLYSLFLDDDLQYSCAYFETPGMGIDEAQLRKKQHIAAKLLLAPGMSVLDIGCGYGGLAIYLAETFGVTVTGVTLSTEQHAVAEQRAAERGLEGKVRFLLQDYRDVTGRFDRIVSVGMFEHVGRKAYPEFLALCHERLAADGLLLLHTVARLFGPAHTNTWVSKYIFPGGHSPALSEVAPVVERSGFVLADLEVLRLHYADTLRAWRERFLANRAAAAALYDERFCRMWEFYLASFEASFRYADLVVFQLQLAKRLDTVPRTRDYLYA